MINFKFFSLIEFCVTCRNNICLIHIINLIFQESIKQVFLLRNLNSLKSNIALILNFSFVFNPQLYHIFLNVLKNLLQIHFVIMKEKCVLYFFHHCFLTRNYKILKLLINILKMYLYFV